MRFVDPMTSLHPPVLFEPHMMCAIFKVEDDLTPDRAQGQESGGIENRSFCKRNK
jgi:hypothetical protein